MLLFRLADGSFFSAGGFFSYARGAIFEYRRFLQAFALPPLVAVAAAQAVFLPSSSVFRSFPFPGATALMLNGLLFYATVPFNAAGIWHFPSDLFTAGRLLCVQAVLFLSRERRPVPEIL